MAINLWGKVYYKDTFAGYLRQEPGNRHIFEYDTSYLEHPNPAIAVTLPLQKAPHICEDGLHPFFDNLVAEGWLLNAQSRALNVRRTDRFAILLGFGSDCSGAISIIDPKPIHKVVLPEGQPRDFAALASRASLSGVQPKMGVVKEGNKFRPVKYGELSTHIAKFPAGHLHGLIENEFLATRAFQHLTKGDPVAELSIGQVEGLENHALLIKRFDRTPKGEKIHFEEFNQLLGLISEDKYEADYEDMARFICNNPDLCLYAEVDKLYRRILACFLIGNTDAHLKNFAMLHTKQGLRLTPSYDIVSSAIYPEYRVFALGICSTRNVRIGSLKPKTVVALGEAFSLNRKAIALAYEELHNRVQTIKDVIYEVEQASDELKQQLHQMVQKRWNATFALIGRFL